MIIEEGRCPEAYVSFSDDPDPNPPAQCELGPGHFGFCRATLQSGRRASWIEHRIEFVAPS